MWCHWCGVTTVRPPKSSREWNPEAMNDALEAISHRSLDWLEILFGDAMLTIAGVLRGLFVAAPGHDLISSDFTAIEGVVIAALAGETWRTEAFAQDRSLYVESASRAFKIPVADMERHKAETGQHHPMRQIGKGMELGLGFGGWINALRQFDVAGTDDELKNYVLAWRDASPAIVHLWGGQRGGPGHDRWERRMFGLEGAAVMAVLNPGSEQRVDRFDGTPTGVSYLMRGEVLYCRVPTGGLITYHRPRLTPAAEEWRGLALSFEGWNTNPKGGPMGWVRMNTYSGKLAENLVQKVARDKQMGAIHRVEHSGYPVVMHTYDEIVSEVPIDWGSVEHFEGLMTTPEPWNIGWPLKAAGGWRGERYRKG
jgi:DNA polymerase